MNLTFLKSGNLLVSYYWLIVLLLLSACSNKIEDINKMSDEEYEKERALNVTFIVSQEGVTKARIYCNIFERSNNHKVNYVDFLDSVYVEFFNTQKEVDNKLTAKQARFYPESGDIVVQDSVRLITKDSDTLYTKKLFYSGKIEKIYTIDSVRIQNGSQVTTGSYLEANKDFSWIRIYNQKGTIPVENNEMDYKE